MLTVRKPEESDELGSITMTELAEYRKLTDQWKCLSNDLETRRDSLISRIKAGARVEIGPWLPQLVRIEQKRFSANEVARIAGRELMEEIRSQIKPTVCEIFGMIPRPGWEDDEDGDLVA